MTSCSPGWLITLDLTKYAQGIFATSEVWVQVGIKLQLVALVISLFLGLIEEMIDQNDSHIILNLTPAQYNYY